MRFRDRLRVPLAFVIAFLLMAWPYPCGAYSVLTHEAIIDTLWDSHISPLLLGRFPEATPEDLRKAHAYAYGGAIIQDMGYYPRGSKFFSDLTHYFRSGDFVEALLRDSQDLNEYAFALGAMAHYAADTNGHRLATNLAVPILYPKLKRKYGNVVTYEDDPLAHVKTEFGFDVLQVAKGRYAPEGYRDFIGFEVAQPLVDRAFQETYGLELKSIFADEPRTIGSFRHGVSSLIPRATRIAWRLKQNEIRNDIPGITKKKFLYNLSRASYEKTWGKNYERPGAWDTFLAFVYRILPRIGPLRVLTFRTPTPETEKLFESSFNVTVDRYRALLTELGKGEVNLPNNNFDVGQMTARGEYRLSDAACARLLDKLAENNFAEASPELRAELLRFFTGPEAAPSAKLSDKARIKLDREVEMLKSATVIPILADKK
jgi:hypothetical protein